MSRRAYVYWNTLIALAFLNACGPLSGMSAARQAHAQRVKSSRSLALQWLESAAENDVLNNPTYAVYKTKINALKSILENREIIVDTSSNGPCSENTYEEFTMAYVKQPPQNSDIYLCKESFDFQNSIVAQVLIHEGIHITGETDECNTTLYEVNITLLAGQQPFKNVYVGSAACSRYRNTWEKTNFIILEEGDENYLPQMNWNPLPIPQGMRY